MKCFTFGSFHAKRTAKKRTSFEKVCSRKATKIIIVLIAVFIRNNAANDFICPLQLWTLYGNKGFAFDCTDMKLEKIPNFPPSDISTLKLSENPLNDLSEKRAFTALFKLQFLYLNKCRLSYIHQDAFGKLQELILLDLSNNVITKLNPNTFNDLSKLRQLYLNNNHIEKLNDGLFNNLKLLLRIELQNNHIIEIGPTAFLNLPELARLNLSVNRMMTMESTMLQKQTQIMVDLSYNPWKCDCLLRPLRNRHLSPMPTCAEPPDLKDHQWNEVEPDRFACKPNIFDNETIEIIHSQGESVTLSCKAYGDPPPDINWSRDDLISFGSSDDYSGHRYSISRYRQGNYKWVNLTIVNLNFDDIGEFTCLAENPAGSDRKVIWLVIKESKSSSLYIFICVGIIIIIICILFIIRIYRKEKNSKKVQNTQSHILSLSSRTPADLDRISWNSANSYMSIKTQYAEAMYDHLDSRITHECSLPYANKDNAESKFSSNHNLSQVKSMEEKSEKTAKEYTYDIPKYPLKTVSTP